MFGLCLCEYEVARSRADALTKFNSPQSPRKTLERSGAGGSKYGSEQQHLLQPVLSEDEGFDGPPTTESFLSLTRLRFTVTSIFALREAARIKVDHYGETLDFLVAYNPDSALPLDTDTLHRGLYYGQWMRAPISDGT